MPQLLDHAIEGGGEFADLVLGRDRDGLVEAARLDLAGAGEQQPHRSRDATGDEERESKSDHRREDGDDARNDHRLALATDHCRRTGEDLLQHVGADRVDLLVELVAYGVEMLQGPARLRHLLAFDLLEEFCVVLIHVVTQLGESGFDAGLDPRQPGIVGRRPLVVDDRVDVRARGLAFLVDLPIGLLEFAQARRIGLLLRGACIFIMTIRRSATERSSERMLARARWP